MCSSPLENNPQLLNRDPVEEIDKESKLFDDHEIGRDSFKNLKRVAKELGERLTDEENQSFECPVSSTCRDRQNSGETNWQCGKLLKRYLIWHVLIVPTRTIN